MGMCLVQNVKNWLQLAKFDYTRNVWVRVGNVYPYEFEDTRFRKACVWLDEGFKFYPSTVTLDKATPISIPSKILDEIREENEKGSNFIKPVKLDTRDFFQSLNLEKPEKPQKPAKPKSKKQLREEYISKLLESSQLKIPQIKL